MTGGLGLYLIGAGLLVVAGLAKALKPADTARALAQAVKVLKPRSWVWVVRLIALAETGVGIWALVSTGTAPALAVGASYAAFTLLVIAGRLVDSPLSTCGCFGKADTPPTRTHAVITLVVAVGALLWAFAGHAGLTATVIWHQPYNGMPLLAGCLLAAWLAYLVMVPLARLGAIRAEPVYLSMGGR